MLVPTRKKKHLIRHWFITTTSGVQEVLLDLLWRKCQYRVKQTARYMVHIDCDLFNDSVGSSDAKIITE